MDEDNHKHGHSHGHSHDVSNVKGTNFIVTVILNLIITVAEIIGGIYSGSLSLISDALHNLSDAIAIVISYVAIIISKKDIANTIGAFLLHSESVDNMNIKSAYLHLFSDALSSLGVIIAGILIYFYQIYWIDSVLTVLIALYILKESFTIVKDAMSILMQGAPKGIKLNGVVDLIKDIDGVENVHHVHLWSLDENNINFEAHVNVRDMLVSETKKIDEKIIEELHEHFKINHVTIQFESDGCRDVGIIKKKGMF
ncbi:cation diffusion facilitator family transporter [Clostridium algoriphilum]|uniref:cation diffusion facilitator family transporter n=1 Tax=Clostridium algoriphilum TaxID=198347 RepID=UPI001CF37D6D|nr:cation diffusion facilitator family transporter [Clostridium algoriphilum]MCB2294529.1 cation diffusion facilitator family transporter [Clostridium algoriphilum]